jgi:O-antigen/teichoic acid export membrane protein
MSGADVALAAKGGGILFAGRVFSWGARFLIAIMLARLIGVEQYGLYNIALTVATLGSAFSVIGLDSALIRYVAVFRRRSDRAGLLGTLQVAIGLPMLASVLAAIAVFALAGMLAREVIGDARLEPLFRIVALLVPALVANSVLAATLQGAQRIGWAVLAEGFGQPTLRFGLLLGFALFGLTAELAILASTLSALIISIVLLVFVQRQVSLAGITTGAERHSGSLLRFSLPVYFSNIVHTLGANLQTLLLGALSTVAAAGVFAVANQIMLVGSIFHSAIVQASMPIFAELHDGGDTKRLEHLYQTTSKWTLTLNLPFALMALVFPQALLGLFGPDFVDGTPALMILAIASLANAATGTSGAILDMTGHTQLKLLNSTVSVGLAIVLNLLFIPSLGVVGAAVAVLGAVSSVNLLRVGEVLWLVRVAPYDRSWGKPLFAGLAAGGAGLAVSRLLADQHLALQALTGIAVLMLSYILLLRWFGLSDDDRLILSRATRRFGRVRVAESTRPSTDAPRPAAVDGHEL